MSILLVPQLLDASRKHPHSSFAKSIKDGTKVGGNLLIGSVVETSNEERTKRKEEGRLMERMEGTINLLKQIST